MPPTPRHKLGHDDCNGLIRLALCGDFLDILYERLQQQAVGGVKNDQTRPTPPDVPLLAYYLPCFWIDGDVYGGDVVGKRTRIAQRLECPPMHAAQRQNDAMADDARWRAIMLERQVGRQIAIVM